MYAFLNGNTLDITGPTGYGFGITGNWTETTTTNFFTQQVAATYTAAGTLQLGRRRIDRSRHRGRTRRHGVDRGAVEWTGVRRRLGPQHSGHDEHRSHRGDDPDEFGYNLNAA